MGKAQRSDQQQQNHDSRGSGSSVAPGKGTRIEALSRAGGSPLASGTRAALESASGADLTGVRVHTGSDAASAASAAGAKAFTVGSDIYFGKGNYNAGGDALLAHEVAHTIQQGSGEPRVQAKLETSTPGDAHEREADAFASAFMSGSPTPALSTGPTRLARKEDPRAEGENQEGASGAGPGKVVWHSGRGLTLSNFGQDSSDLKPEHVVALAELRSKLEAVWIHKQGWSIDEEGNVHLESWAKAINHVWGFASPEGDADNNSDLSSARARSVASELGESHFYEIAGRGVAGSSTDPAKWPAMRKVVIKTEPWEIDMSEDDEESFVGVNYHERIETWVPRVSEETDSVYLEHLLRKLTKGGEIQRGLDDFLSHNAVGMLDVGKPISTSLIDQAASSAADALIYALERPTYEDFKASIEHLDRAIVNGLDRASKKNSFRATDHGPASAIADWIRTRMNTPGHIYSAYGSFFQRYSDWGAD